MIKSQSDLNPCNDGKRSSEVLIEAISKAERLQKQLDIALKIIDAVMQDEYTMETIDGGLSMYMYTGLEKIKELDNEIHKQAS